MLYRAPSPYEPPPPGAEQFEGKSIRGDESFAGAVSESNSRLSEKGLYLISLITFAPSHNNALPFYFHTGLIYMGLIPARDKDRVGVGIAYGNLSADKIKAEVDGGIGVHHLRSGCRMRLPDPAQCLVIRPARGGIRCPAKRHSTGTKRDRPGIPDRYDLLTTAPSLGLS